MSYWPWRPPIDVLEFATHNVQVFRIVSPDVTNSLEIFNVSEFNKLRRVSEATGEIPDGRTKVTRSAPPMAMPHSTNRNGYQTTNAPSGAFLRKILLKDGLRPDRFCGSHGFPLLWVIRPEVRRSPLLLSKAPRHDDEKLLSAVAEPIR
jgi:hypothetical protein